MYHQLISIHLMLWFYEIWTRLQKLNPCISIHLMLWFYICWKVYMVKAITISIHLMLWFYKQRSRGELMENMNFNTSHVMVLSVYLGDDKYTEIFQYISCYGSIYLAQASSSVSFSFQYISCYGSIKSLTLIFLVSHYFNTSHVMVLCAFLRCIRCYLTGFQYISCYGSI